MLIRSKRSRSLIYCFAFAFTGLLALTGCSRKSINKGFSGEIAYDHIETLGGYGPREPGTKAIAKAQSYIETTLNGYGWKVSRQSFKDQTPIGEKRFVNLPSTGQLK